jgi:hypothetical protein
MEILKRQTVFWMILEPVFSRVKLSSVTARSQHPGQKNTHIAK